MNFSQWLWRSIFFRSGQCIFTILLLSPLAQRHGSSFWPNLNSFYPRMLGAKFIWNWSSASWEDFLKVVNLFSLFLNQFESPLPKDVLYPVWLKIALWFCRSWKCGMFKTMTENRQIFRKATCNLSLRLRWAKEVNLSTEHNLCKLISQMISESCFSLSLESWDKL